MDLYLIDGNSYVYRAFYAIKGLTNSKGLPTNAAFGFTNMLLKIIREKKPGGLAVCFDSPARTERHELFEDYKAQRPETPSELVVQFPYIRNIISAFHIKAFEVPGYEADDVIGTIARKAAREGNKVFIVTADKDMLQLVDDSIKIYDPMKERTLDADYVRERFGVGPERVTEFMALTGDPVDNIPGIKGVGEKTAKELLSNFASIEDLLGHPERIKRERLREMVLSSKDIVMLSKKLATIEISVPLDLTLSEFVIREPDWLSLLSLFRELEFSSFMKLIPSLETLRSHETIDSLEKLAAVLSSVSDRIAFDTEAAGRNPLTDRIAGIAFCTEEEKSYYVPISHSYPGAGKQPDKGGVFQNIGPLLGKHEIAKIGHNLKNDIMLLGHEGVSVEGELYDTMIAAYLLNPNKTGYSLEEVSFEYLSAKKKSFVEVLKKRKSFEEVSIEEAADYATEDAALSLELCDVLFPKLREESLEKVYFDIEMPLIKILVEIEKSGIKLDTDLLKSLAVEMAVEIESIQKRIFFLSGEEFNINSPKQLSRVLFQSLGLSPTKKTKTGFSTGMDVLEELAEHHALPLEVLHYRSLSKLKTTYLDVLPSLVKPETGRIHTSFNQAATATGRLSSSDPNLQNIPIRGPWGRRIRQAFIAEEGNLLLSADYSQVELRVLAHISKDEGLNEAFHKGLDIHIRTAAEIFGVPFDEVTQDMRRTAKTVNFGVIYGISAFGLSETLNIERADAQKYINQYFDRHPGVSKYTEKTLEEAARQGYVATLFGRKRPVPELKSHNKNIRQQGERLAVNSPIQGTAADIIKIAMIRISRRFREEAMQAKMILQVHDELLFELPCDELEKVRVIVKEEMEGAVELSVPLKVELGQGQNWAEAH